jgi:hypothetical protein
MTDLLALAERCEAAAQNELDNALATLARMNDNAREHPIEAFGSAVFGNIGGLFALAAELRARTAIEAARKQA